MVRTILSAMLGLFVGVAAVYGEDVVTEPILTLSDHLDSVASVAFSPDGTKVLTGGRGDRTARLHNATTGAWIRTFDHGSTVQSVAFSRDGAKVLTGGDNTARMWNAATGGLLGTFGAHTIPVTTVGSVAFSPDCTTILTGSGYAQYTAKLWDAATGARIRTFSGHTGGVYSAVFSVDGTRVLTGAGNPDNTAKLWETATGSCLRTFTGHARDVLSVAFSPDGAKVLTGSEDGTAKLWNASTGSVIRTFTGHSSAVCSVAFSPDGTKVLTGSWDGTAKLWNASTGSVIRTFTGDVSFLLSVAYSPDGTTVLTGNADGTAKLWGTGPELLVRSTPITGVSIGGDVAGDTDFSKMFSEASQSVTLTAPLLATSGATRYDFVRWEIDGEQQPQGETSVQFTVQGMIMTATAVYEIRAHTLTVVSEPFANLDIMGDDPGDTPYCATRTDQEAVHLALDSPVNIMHGGSSYNFVYWLIDGVPQPRGCTSVDILMDADRTATAVYNLFADANGDCAVNVLDLIFVRNRLGANPNTGDNWRADIVPGDGAINVLDLIAVRNYLGTRCSE